MASEIHQDDIGTRFLITVKDDGVLVNISGDPGVSTHQLNIRKPDDVVINRSASLQDVGISGVRLSPLVGLTTQMFIRLMSIVIYR